MILLFWCIFGMHAGRSQKALEGSRMELESVLFAGGAAEGSQGGEKCQS